MSLKNLVTALFLTNLLSCPIYGANVNKRNYSVRTSLVLMRFFSSNTIEQIKGLITQETVSELSDLVLRHPYESAEGGGAFYLSEKRVIFREIKNTNEDIIADLERRDPCNRETVNYMKILLENYFESGGECSAETTDAYWGMRVRTLRSAIFSEQFNGCANNAMDLLRSGLRDRYSAESTYYERRNERFLGYVHTHNNEDELTGFSDIDLCASFYQPQFLVTHNYPKGDAFELWVANNGQAAKIDTYELRE